MTRKPWLRLSIFVFAVALGACGEDPVDLQENCAVTGDEDGNGDADCDDIECSLLAECQPRCGDGDINVDGEVCDDGNDIDGDGCDSDCSETGCGNGILTGDEVCDDGNAVESDGCDTNCTVSACGNDVIGTDEECDDANDVDGDGCDSNCTTTACGNGIQTKDEGCDDGNDVDGDTCDSNCTTPGCGNGVQDPTEMCDDGNPDSGDGCDANCTPTGCGNGVLTGTEACDDGNTMNNDGCSSTCVIECGNGQVTGAEECDGTNFLGQNCITRGYIGGTIACTSECMLDVSACVSPGCPNDVLELGEDCEGTDLGGNTCTSIGQGFVGGTLACDAPTCEFDTDGCIAPGCGNTVLEIGEQCDDGDLDPGDGCDENCMIEGVISEIEPNEDGTPGVGGSGINGNDFNATAVVNATNNGVRDVAAGDGLIAAAINPVGDEDVFAFSNSLGIAVQLRVDLYNFATGIGQPCGTTLNTGMHIRNAGGGSLASNDDRSGTADQCSGITYVVAAGTTVYVHTMEYGDNLAVASYGIRFDWTVPVCGNGTTELGEQCDDGGTDPGDGCSATCTIEGVVGEVESNNSTADADGNSVQITGDVLISGSITDATDENDYFRVTVASQSIVRFETFTSLFDCDTATSTTMRLRDNLGVEILNDSGTGIRACSAIVIPLEPGTYYLQVEESGTNATIPLYYLEAQFMESAGAESEPANMSGTNDTRQTASANLVGLDEVYVFGDHTLSSDDDWYAITVPAGAGIRAEVIEGNRPIEDCESLNLDADLTLFDASGTQLVDDDLDGRGWCPLIDGTGSAPTDAAARNTSGAPATYFLRVQGYGTDADDNNIFVYRLQITLR
jgi:cysteine-rich repeat protein